MAPVALAPCPQGASLRSSLRLSAAQGPASSPLLGLPVLRGKPAANGARGIRSRTQDNGKKGAVVIARAKREASERRDRDEAAAEGPKGERGSSNSSRREVVLMASSTAVLASIFHFSGPRPSFLGTKRNPPSLALCPATPNCVSTSEELNDPGHYIPPWSYNPEDGRGRRNPASQTQAMEELVAVVTSTTPDGFEPTIIERRPDYLYVEYASPLFGFVDDVEFWFPPGPGSLVEYRSASRIGESDLDINRKRIKALRQALEKYGWESIGF